MNTWESVALTPPPTEWIDNYITDYVAHQEHEQTLITELKEAYNANK